MNSESENNSLKISSNLNYIESNMNLIQESISNSNCSSKKLSINFECNGNVYELMNKCLNLYFYATNNLFDKLVKESKIIIAMGESIQSLDNELSKDAGDL